MLILCRMISDSQSQAGCSSGIACHCIEPLWQLAARPCQVKTSISIAQVFQSDEVVSIAAMLSVIYVFRLPSGSQQAADAAKARFAHIESEISPPPLPYPAHVHKEQN